jgi:hypothetical protein
LRTGREFDCHPPRQDLALNLSAKRRLCKTVGGRFIDGTTCCCAVSSARSRAAATTDLARSNQSLVLRALYAETKRCVLVNIFMICPPVGWWLADHDQISAPGSRPSHGYNPATTQLGTQSAQGTQSWDQRPLSPCGEHFPRIWRWRGGQKKIPGLLEGRGLRWIPEALEVSGLTRQQSTRFQARWQVTARRRESGGSGRLDDPLYSDG